MSDTPNDGGPAFPFRSDGDDGMLSRDGLSIEGGPGEPFAAYGMSLRDWLAGQALAGMLANPDWSSNNTYIPDSGNSLPEIAWKTADAMIAAREGGAQ
jgi:hypothetical protein